MEEWKDIKGYEGLYQVSNIGRVKSFHKGREKILKICFDSKKYPIVFLSNNDKKQTLKIHQLVWDAFGDSPREGMIKQIDHIDNNKSNNNINNLRLVSNRENSAKRSLTLKKTSRFTGVRENPRKDNSWYAQIRINHKATYLGTFESEVLAALAYQKALISLGENI